MTILLVDGDYSIFYWRSHNKIIINLPPTVDTIQDSMVMPVDRRVDLIDNELLTLLKLAEMMCKVGLDDERPL